ncbi:MAG: cupin domain-containing protein [Lentisphaeria bacterium]|nr:cupin domain-containing protein [Lentisphaeria bacterium]
MIRKCADMKVDHCDNMRGGQGTVHFRHFFTAGEFTAKTRLCAMMTVPPGASVGRHCHAAEDEVYIVMSGAGVLDDGETRTRIEAGDAVLTGNGEAHAVENDGDEDLVIIAVIMRHA